MKKYYVDHPEKENYEIEIPRIIIDKIIREHMQTTYYWSFGILCTIIGFLTAVIVK